VTKDVPKQPPKINEDTDDIAELERRVQAAKKVLEVMVKAKETQRSSSRESGRRDKKRSKKPRRDSSSD
jgi:hypothetical protein